MKLSIIVCTRNRAKALEPCLASIAEALSGVPPIEAELLIVDNGSTDGTASRVVSWAASKSFNVRLLWEPRKGLSVARNHGVSEAHGELLAFTDDDCRLSTNYISDLLRHFNADTEPVLRGGRVELGDPSDLPLSIKTVDIEQVWRKSEDSAQNENLGDSIIGCNMAMPHALAERIGPFDERLGAGSSIPGGEDTDYILRAYRAGVPISYVPDMAVRHFHGRKTPAEGRALFCNYAYGWGALYAKHALSSPSFCRPFYWDIKNAIKEFVIMENTFMPDVQFSHRDKVLYSTVGALKFALASVH